MSVVRAADRPMQDLEFRGVSARGLIDAESSAGAITLGELVLVPGAHLPLHHHRVEEGFYVIDGRGTLLLGDAEHAIGPGDGLLAPAGVQHGLRNDTDVDLRLAFFYPAINPWTAFA